MSRPRPGSFPPRAAGTRLGGWSAAQLSPPLGDFQSAGDLQDGGRLAVSEPQQQIGAGGPDGGVSLAVAGYGDRAVLVVEGDPPLAGAVGGGPVAQTGGARDAGRAEQAGQELGHELLDTRSGDTAVDRGDRWPGARDGGVLGVPAVDGQLNGEPAAPPAGPVVTDTGEGPHGKLGRRGRQDRDGLVQVRGVPGC